MANFGDILSNINLSAGQSIRRNSAGTAFEAYTPSSGITIGSAITSGTNDRVLYQSGGNLAQSANFTFNGTELSLNGTIIVKNGTKHFEIALDSNYRGVFGHSFSASDNIPQYEFKYYSAGGYATRGLMLSDVGNGLQTILNQTANGSLYITDASGAAGSLTLGTRTNPNDASKFDANYQSWKIWDGSGSTTNQKFGVNVSPSATIHAVQTTEQLRLGYDASNYIKATVDANGTVTFDAVGTTPKFIFNDEFQHAGNKFAVFGATPIVQSANIGQITDSTDGSIVAPFTSVGMLYSGSEIDDRFHTLIDKINKLENIVKNYGFTA